MEERKKDKGNKVCVDESYDDGMCVDDEHVVPIHPHAHARLRMHHPRALCVYVCAGVALASVCSCASVRDVKTTSTLDTYTLKRDMDTQRAELLDVSAVDVSKVWRVIEYDTSKADTINGRIEHPISRIMTSETKEARRDSTLTISENASQSTENTEVAQVTTHEEKVEHARAKWPISGRVGFLLGVVSVVLVLLVVRKVKRLLS